MPDSVVELKGYRDGLHLVIDSGAKMEDIIAQIEERMAKLGNSLAGTGVRIDLGRGALQTHELNQLERMLQEIYGLEIKQRIDKSSHLAESLQDSPVLGATPPHKPQDSGSDYSLTTEDEKTQFVRQTMRSGQVERFLEGNVVILGDVNPGAEVIAAGDVVVLGTLRGIAHAGALGNTSAVIIAINLVPTQLRIGCFITRPPSRKQRPRDTVEIARTQTDGTIVVEAFEGL